MENPCLNCITLPICYANSTCDDDKIFLVLNKCSSLRTYCRLRQFIYVYQVRSNIKYALYQFTKDQK